MEKTGLNPLDERCEKRIVLDLSKWMKEHPSALAALSQAENDYNLVGFSSDINAFNRKGTRCVRVLDDEGRSREGYHFFILGTQKIGDKWVVSYVNQCGASTGIDVMNEANMWLNQDDK